MEIIDRLEDRVDRLLAYCHKLQQANVDLTRENELLKRERVCMLEEIDSILRRLDLIQLEDS